MAASLDAAAVTHTATLLRRRVEQRFPGSGLAGVALELERVAQRTRERAAAIGRPILWLRVVVSVLIALIAAGLVGTLLSLHMPTERVEVFQFVQVLESGINDVVLVGAGVFFLLTFETRLKRRRALQALRELRAIAHIIDMHQLTKDPEWVLQKDESRGEETGVLPARQMTRFELSRYLDYCSELLSITGKIAALYIQDFDDGGALAAVNEIEDLTTGLSRKIWQKLMVLYTPAS
jgi:hypothetical protein